MRTNPSFTPVPLAPSVPTGVCSRQAPLDVWTVLRDHLADTTDPHRTEDRIPVVTAGYGVPATGHGKAGDFCVDLWTGLWYRKNANGWIPLVVPVVPDPNKADLVNGVVPASQLPSYVDDVLEFDTRSAFPVKGETGKIYVTKDTNLTYRWGGTAYVQVGGTLDFVRSVNGQAALDVTLTGDDIRVGKDPRSVTIGVKLGMLDAEMSTKRSLTDMFTPWTLGTGVTEVFWSDEASAWFMRVEGGDNDHLITSDKDVLKLEYNGGGGRVFTATRKVIATEDMIPVFEDAVVVAGEGIGSTVQKTINPASATECHAYGLQSHAEGHGTTAGNVAKKCLTNDDAAKRGDVDSGYGAHSEGVGARAVGKAAHAEGEDTLAKLYAGHAEGSETTADGDCTHAEGKKTRANGYAAHTEGWGTVTEGETAHAGGKDSRADGDQSFAHGLNVNARGPQQAAFGRYNALNSVALFVIGNGSSDAARSNVFEVYDKTPKDEGGVIVIPAKAAIRLGSTTGSQFAVAAETAFTPGASVTGSSNRTAMPVKIGLRYINNKIYKPNGEVLVIPDEAKKPVQPSERAKEGEYADALATFNAIVDATKLTPSYGEWVVVESEVPEDSEFARYVVWRDEKDVGEFEPLDENWGWGLQLPDTDFRRFDTVTCHDKNALELFLFDDKVLIRSIVGYTLGSKDEPVLLTEDSKVALFEDSYLAEKISDVAEATVESKAVGEIEAAGGSLIVKDDDGEEQFNSAKAVRYELASASSTTFNDMAINYLVIAATESTDPIQQAVTIPTVSVDGRAIDVVVDCTCNHAAGAVLQPSDSAIVLLPEAEAVDNITIGGGERVLITFTQLPGTKTFMTGKKVLVKPEAS